MGDDSEWETCKSLALRVSLRNLLVGYLEHRLVVSEGFLKYRRVSNF
jgi:hypothetical protein